MDISGLLNTGRRTIAANINRGMQATPFITGDEINKGLIVHKLNTKAHVLSQFTNAAEVLKKVDTTKPVNKSAEIIKSIMNAACDDMLEKGEISDALGRGYGGTPLTFKKTGKDLKAIMPKVVSALQTELATVAAQMEVLQEKIGSEPTEDRRSYYMKKLCCKMYPWKMCEPLYDSNTRTYADITDENKLCAKFNTLCSMFLDLNEDIAAANVILNNVEDKTSYTLTVSQLAALSF